MHQTSQNLESVLLRTLGFTGLALGIILLFWHTSAVWLLMFVSLLFAILLHTLAKPFIRYTPLPAGGALSVVILLLIVAFSVGGYLFAPPLVSQIGDLFQQLPEAIQQARDSLTQYAWAQPFLEQFNSEDAAMPNVLSRVSGTFSMTLDSITYVLFVMFVSVFFAANPDLYHRGFLQLIPPAQRQQAASTLHEIIDTLRNWLLGRFISMVVVGIVTTIGLSIIGVPLALSLGLLTGLLEFMPVLGPILAAIPAILLAFTEGNNQVLWVLGLFVVIEQLEGNLLVPLMQQRTVSLPPAVTMAAIFTFGILFGFLGLLVATPLAAAILVLVQKLYTERQNEEHSDEEQSNEEPSDEAPRAPSDQPRRDNSHVKQEHVKQEVVQ